MPPSMTLFYTQKTPENQRCFSPILMLSQVVLRDKFPLAIGTGKCFSPEWSSHALSGRPSGWISSATRSDEWLFSRLDPFMLSQVFLQDEFLLAMRTGEWLFSRLDLSCSFSLSFRTNFFLQWEQLNGLSPKWILSCDFCSSFKTNFFLQ